MFSELLMTPLARLRVNIENFCHESQPLNDLSFIKRVHRINNNNLINSLTILSQRRTKEH